MIGDWLTMKLAIIGSEDDEDQSLMQKKGRIWERWWWEDRGLLSNNIGGRKVELAENEEPTSLNEMLDKLICAKIYGVFIITMNK